MQQQILGLAEAANLLGVNRETARRWAVSQIIPAFKLHDRGHWKFYASDVDKYIQRRQAERAPEQGKAPTGA